MSANHSEFCGFKEAEKDETPEQPAQVEVKPPVETAPPKTSDFYAVTNLPDRFDHPDWFKGYGLKVSDNPMYRTTTSDYGRLAPNVHTMPTVFYSRTQTFTKNLGPCGMYRNHSLNTAKDQSYL